MKTSSHLLALSLLLAALAPLAHTDTKVPIAWGKEQLSSAKLPDRLGAPAKKAIAEWEPWAAEHGYKIDLDEKGRVLLLSPANSSQAEKQLELITKAEKWFDKVLPVPDRKPIAIEKRPVPEAKNAPAAPSSGTDEIPEDPESAPPTVVKGNAPKPLPSGTTSSVWGLGSVAPDTETGVVLALHDEDDAASAAAYIAQKIPALKSWADKVKDDVGFVIQMPLVAACVANASGQEEWNPDHELVSRVVRLLTLRRFGQTSLWALYGIAWEAEMDLDGLIYVFPYRDEFIGVGEHGAWPNELKNEFKDRVNKPLDLAEFGTMERGTYDGHKARLAWGFVHFLAAKLPGKLSAMLEEMRQFRDADDRKDKGGGLWERDPNYEIPLAEQMRIIKKHTSPEVFKGASAFLRKLGDEPKETETETEKAIRK